MSSEDKKKDFIDIFLEDINPYKQYGVRFGAIISCLGILCFLGMFLAPLLIQMMTTSMPYTITLHQTSPFEVFYNYIKIGFFFSLFFTFPVAVYQFGKLKYNNPEFKEKMDLLLAASVTFLLLLTCYFLTYKFFFPLEIYVLYGLNFKVATLASSLSSMVSMFISTYLIAFLFVLLPFLRYLIKKSLLFNYATFIKYKKTIFIYMGVLSVILALPVEILSLFLIFIILVVWYKILIYFARKRD